MKSKTKKKSVHLSLRISCPNRENLTFRGPLRCFGPVFLFKDFFSLLLRVTKQVDIVLEHTVYLWDRFHFKGSENMDSGELTGTAFL